MTSRETSGGDGLDVKAHGVCLPNVKSKYVQQTASSPVASEAEKLHLNNYVLKKTKDANKWHK